jgi:hypothetical protein
MTTCDLNLLLSMTETKIAENNTSCGDSIPVPTRLAI